MTDPALLYTERADSYVRFVRSVGYPQALRAFFVASPLLRSDLRVLDAGCGTGLLILAMRDAMLARTLRLGPLHGFDLTPVMLERFRATLRARSIDGIEVVQADVLDPTTLPSSWRDFDVVISASMMEYLPRARLVDALRGLRGLLGANGRLVLFITRGNWLMQLLIGRWWDANLYSSDELRAALHAAELSDVSFRKFPQPFGYLGIWGHIVEARR